MKGFNVLLSIGDREVAAQINAQLNRTTRYADISNKIELEWDNFISNSKTWNVVCGGAYVLSDAAMVDLENAYMNSEDVDVKLSNGQLIYRGKAIISSFPVGAAYNKDVTYSLNLQGKGPLIRDESI